MSNVITVVTDDVGMSLSRWVAQTKDRLVIVAPFIKRPALERLVAVVAPSVALTILTRWRVEEIGAGISDLSVFDLVRERQGSRMLLHPRIHAKMLLVDDAIAVVGSANISDSALGFNRQPNAEVIAALNPVPNRLFLFLRQLLRASVPATAELRHKFEEAARTALPPTAHTSVEVQLPLPAVVGSHFPSFRNPERLYHGYLSVAEFRDQETRAAILDDLEALSVPDGLEQREFVARVGFTMLAFESIMAFGQFVAKPRFFGEMAEWLSTRPELDGQDAEQRTQYLQTLIRWLIHFLPGRYRLQQPGYSELFGRADGWEKEPIDNS